MDFRKALYEIRKCGILMTVNHRDPTYDIGNELCRTAKKLEQLEKAVEFLENTEEKRERVYEHNGWIVIKRLTEYGIRYSVVRCGSVFFERTYPELSTAIAFCDRN